jgi:hypothetical protein
MGEKTLALKERKVHISKNKNIYIGRVSRLRMILFTSYKESLTSI